MSRFKLTYFDFDGGRGEPIRITFHAAGVDFEDHRISFEEFMKTRGDLRFTCAPELEVDSVTVTQSNSMLRYVGKMAGLYPEDDLQALYCDEALGVVEDSYHRIVNTIFLEGDELKEARENLVDSWLTAYLKGLDEMLTRGGGQYFADNSLTVADLKVFVQVRSLLNGTLDHVPADLVERLAPQLLEHNARVDSDPIVVAYYNSRGN